MKTWDKHDVPRDRDLLLPVFLALRELGGTGTNQDIYKRVIDNLQIPKEIVAVCHVPNGKSELDYRIRWARTYLKKCGIIDNIKAGVWKIQPAYANTTYLDSQMIMDIGHSNKTGIQPAVMFRQRPWSRVELILALALYYELPYSQFQVDTKAVQQLAGALGRIPDDVVRQLYRFKKLAHDSSAQDSLSEDNLSATVWHEFSTHHWKLAQDQDDLLHDIQRASCEIFPEELPVGYTKEYRTSVRVGQQFFRQAVLCNYENRCCMTGIAIPTLLVASHIKPWKDSDDATEKANPQNGLCLNALHDKAFDQGLITVDNQYRIVVSSVLKKSKTLDETTKQWICAKERQPIQLPERGKPDKAFLEYHQDHVFQHERMV